MYHRCTHRSAKILTLRSVLQTNGQPRANSGKEDRAGKGTRLTKFNLSWTIRAASSKPCHPYRNQFHSRRRSSSVATRSIRESTRWWTSTRSISSARPWSCRSSCTLWRLNASKRSRPSRRKLRTQMRAMKNLRNRKRKRSRKRPIVPPLSTKWSKSWSSRRREIQTSSQSLKCSPKAHNCTNLMQ